MSHLYPSTTAPVHGAIGAIRSTNSQAIANDPLTQGGLSLDARAVLSDLFGKSRAVSLADVITVSRGVATLRVDIALSDLSVSDACLIQAYSMGSEPPAAPVVPQPVLVIPPPKPESGLAALAPRQREVLDLLRSGGSNKQIALKMGLTEGTVKVHITAILKALGANNRTQAVIIAEHLTAGEG